MTKIPIVTQNFSSPDAFSDTPLMLLPQTPLPPLPDRDQDGFNQLLLHDLHRHRQSYCRSFTAFETLKKRQDFVLRQENLRALQNLEQRVTAKQEQFVDQSLHSYEQCFVKVINGNSLTNGNIHHQQKRPKSAAPSFDKFHSHQLSHIQAAPLGLELTPYHRYQKSHRPPVSTKYRSNSSIQHSAQSFHDAFQSSSFLNSSQQFVSFTESYLQKYGDRSSNKFPIAIDNDGMDDIKEHDDDDERIGAGISVEKNQNRRHEQKPKASDLQRIRATMSSRNTNTPSSTPQLGYNDALRDGLTIVKDDADQNKNSLLINEKRRSSQQSTSQMSNADSKTNSKRPKTGKKKQIIITDLISGKKSESTTTTNVKSNENDFLKKAMTVQNYGTNSNNENNSTIIERFPLKKTTSEQRRLSIRLSDNNTNAKHLLDNIDTQMASTTPTIISDRPESVRNDKNQEQILKPVTNTINGTQGQINDKNLSQQTKSELPDYRKRIRKGVFDGGDNMKDMVAFELGMMGGRSSAMKKDQFQFGKENQNDDGTNHISENQPTLDLLEKIRQCSSALNIGQMVVSQQSCRFELPFDLKLLETLTPLDYLSKYCRLSSRRNYQFKRIFDKYRNNQYRFESNNLYTAIVDVHTENFTRSQYENLCQLINIGQEQHQFTYDTFAGILALCERILYNSNEARSGFDERDLAKDTIEKCDFDSLDRKFDGLNISEIMKNLLKTI